MYARHKAYIYIIRHINFLFDFCTGIWNKWGVGRRVVGGGSNMFWIGHVFWLFSLNYNIAVDYLTKPSKQKSLHKVKRSTGHTQSQKTSNWWVCSPSKQELLVYYVNTLIVLSITIIISRLSESLVPLEMALGYNLSMWHGQVNLRTAYHHAKHPVAKKKFWGQGQMAWWWFHNCNCHTSNNLAWTFGDTPKSLKALCAWSWIVHETLISYNLHTKPFEDDQKHLSITTPHPPSTHTPSLNTAFKTHT